MLMRWAVLPLVGITLLSVHHAGAAPASDKAQPASAQTPAGAGVAPSTTKKPAATAFGGDPFADMGHVKPVKKVGGKTAKKAADDDPFASDDKKSSKRRARPSERDYGHAVDERRGETGREVNPRRVVRVSACSLRSVESIRCALEKPLDIDFGCCTPLDDVVEYLNHAMRVPVLLDIKSLSDVGVSSTTPVICSIHGVSARSALSLMLSEIDDTALAWTISHEVVLLTTRERADAMLETVVYDVHDLLASRNQSGQAVSDFEQLLTLLQNAVRTSSQGRYRGPSSWASFSGPGSWAPLEGNGIAAICVSETLHNHEKVARLLADLRKIRPAQPCEPANRSTRQWNSRGMLESSTADRPLADKSDGRWATEDRRSKDGPGKLLILAKDSHETGRVSASPPSEAILDALEKRVDVEFSDATLENAVVGLKDCLQVPILLDRKALRDVGVAPDAEISFHVRGVSARCALNLMLAEFDLAWTISNEVLLITTPEKADSMLETVVYDIHDLIRAPDDMGQSTNGYDQLIDLITSTVRPITWPTGSIGPIAPYTHEGISSLCILQTREVHEEIAKILADLRKARHVKPAAVPGAK